MMNGMEKYAGFLEGFCREVVEHQPEKIGVVCMLPGGQALVGTYGEPDNNEKALMAYHMHMEAVLEAVVANAKQIVAAAKEQEGEE